MISVVIPSFNRAQFLSRAVTSVLEQDFKDFELLVIDDGSTDETNEILEQFEDPRIRKIQLEKNFGVSKARNVGIEKSNYSWVAFLDSDDVWHPSKLQSQVNLLKQNTALKIIHTNELWIKNGEPMTQLKKHKKSGGRLFSSCIPLCCISPSTVLLHKQVLDSVGNFDESFPVCEDYDLWLRACAQFEVGFVEEPQITKYGGHDDQLSRRFFAMDYWRVKAMCKHVGSEFINEDEKKLLVDTILEKCEILLQGYEKHSNFTNYDEISDIRDLVSQKSKAYIKLQKITNTLSKKLGDVLPRPRA